MGKIPYFNNDEYSLVTMHIPILAKNPDKYKFGNFISNHDMAGDAFNGYINGCGTVAGDIILPIQANLKDWALVLVKNDWICYEDYDGCVAFTTAAIIKTGNVRQIHNFIKNLQPTFDVNFVKTRFNETDLTSIFGEYCDIYCDGYQKISCGYGSKVNMVSGELICGDMCEIKTVEQCSIISHDHCDIKLASTGTVITDSNSKIKAQNNSNITANCECDIKTGSDCSIFCVNDCDIKSLNSCFISCGTNNVIKCGNRCSLNVSSGCDINTGENCVIKSDDCDIIFSAGNNSVLTIVNDQSGEFVKPVVKIFGVDFIPNRKYFYNMITKTFEFYKK